MRSKYLLNIEIYSNGIKPSITQKNNRIHQVITSYPFHHTRWHPVPGVLDLTGYANIFPYGGTNQPAGGRTDLPAQNPQQSDSRDL